MTARGKLREMEGGLGVYCPGCECYHLIDDRWKFNNDYNYPTFTPSLLIRYPNKTLCHAFITKGEWRYLTDSFHHLRGKAVKMEPEEN